MLGAAGWYTNVPLNVPSSTVSALATGPVQVEPSHGPGVVVDVDASRVVVVLLLGMVVGHGGGMHACALVGGDQIRPISTTASAVTAAAARAVAARRRARTGAVMPRVARPFRRSRARPGSRAASPRTPSDDTWST